jgi:hypothetical protein
VTDFVQPGQGTGTAPPAHAKGPERSFDYGEARRLLETGLSSDAVGERLGVSGRAVRYACRGAVINRTTTSAATAERRKRQTDGHTDRVSLRRFVELTADDPPIPRNGTCAVCGKPRHPERSRGYAQGCAEIDAFCSSTCARKFHGTSLAPKRHGARKPGIDVCGTSAAYRHGCRCDACKQYERTRKAASRARLAQQGAAA